MAKHFGVSIRDGKLGMKLTRDTYADICNKSSLPKFKSITYADEQGEFYTDEWCENHQLQCLENFDLNMTFFALLDHDVFEMEIQEFLKKHNEFREVSDLNQYNEKSGYYMMVLDEYCQVYIGTTNNIKRRVQQHWSKKTPFDRLLFPIGAVNTSIMTINSFRALDTTRIFAYETLNLYKLENKYINYFSPQYISNRIAGGRITGGLPQAISMMKKRQLT